MLTILGRSQKYCDDISRRAFLRWAPDHRLRDALEVRQGDEMEVGISRTPPKFARVLTVAIPIAGTQSGTGPLTAFCGVHDMVCKPEGGCGRLLAQITHFP